MKEKNSIAVIIPTYNRFHSTLAALQSVLQQTKQAEEIILIDDGSTNTALNFIEQNLPKQVTFLKQTHSGVSIARNKGVSQSVSTWICFLDSDDVWHRDKLKQQLEYHKQNEQCKISQTKEIWIRNEKRVNPRPIHEKKSNHLFKESLANCVITPSSVMIHRSVWEETNGFDPLLPACEDYDLWLQITAQYPIGLIDFYGLTRFGGAKDQLSTAYPAMDRFRIYAILKLLRSNLLSQKQRDLANLVLKEKQAIFIQGQKKRQKETQAIENFFLHACALDETSFINQARIFLLSTTIQ